MAVTITIVCAECRTSVHLAAETLPQGLKDLAVMGWKKVKGRWIGPSWNCPNCQEHPPE